LFIQKYEGNAIEQTLKPAEKKQRKKISNKEYYIKRIAEYKKKELELELAIQIRN
jgi:flagellar hook-basal body complex protein FliE